jgi:hypothetical protein
MPHSTDTIPRREQDLADLCEKWVPTLSDQTKQTAFDWDQAECNTVTGAIEAFLTARSTYETNDSHRNLLIKNEKKEVAIDAMRDFINSEIRYNKKMPDVDKFFLGVRPADTKPTRQPVPSSQPNTEVLPSQNHYEHVVRALNHSGGTSKPEDAYGVRYAWQVGGVKPATGADLPKMQFSRKTTLVIKYTEAEKAQTVYYATCYENSRGEHGPWSPIAEAVIA